MRCQVIFYFEVVERSRYQTVVEQKHYLTVVERS